MFFYIYSTKASEKISPTHNNFEHFLKNQNEMFFFIESVDLRETENKASSLQENKASGPNSFLLK